MNIPIQTISPGELPCGEHLLQFLPEELEKRYEKWLNTTHDTQMEWVYGQIQIACPPGN